MVTLTYGDASAWSPLHVTAYIKAVREWFKRLSSQPLRYVWVAEIQTARLARTGQAVLHYHVIFWMPAGVTMPKADKRGWWPHGSTRTEAAHHPISYLVKYASKVECASGFPKGARLYGIGGVQELLPVLRWWALPTWARGQLGVNADPCRPVGGGILARASGTWLGSPWRVALANGRTLVRQLFSYIGGLDAAGPYSMLPRSA